MPVNVPAGVRGETGRQQDLERRWGAYQDTPQARLWSYSLPASAQRAPGRRRLGATAVAIDLAICALLADGLPPPTASHRGWT